MLNLLIVTIWWDKIMGTRKKGDLKDYLNEKQ